MKQYLFMHAPHINKACYHSLMSPSCFIYFYLVTKNTAWDVTNLLTKHLTARMNNDTYFALLIKPASPSFFHTLRPDFSLFLGQFKLFKFNHSKWLRKFISQSFAKKQ